MDAETTKVLIKLDGALHGAAESPGTRDLRQLCGALVATDNRLLESLKVLGMWAELWERNKLKLTLETTHWNAASMAKLAERTGQVLWKQTEEIANGIVNGAKRN